jgi:hypothetical protein
MSTVVGPPTAGNTRHRGNMIPNFQYMDDKYHQDWKESASGLCKGNQLFPKSIPCIGSLKLEAGSIQRHVANTSIGEQTRMRISGMRKGRQETVQEYILQKGMSNGSK